jgi:hypothetical protein
MTKVSSDLSVFYKMAYPILALGMLIAGIIESGYDAIPCLIFFAACVGFIFVWLRYTLRATTVFIDREFLWFTRSGIRLKVPLKRVVAVESPNWIKHVPVFVTFQNENGESERLLFIASRSLFGVFFTAERVVEKIGELVANAKALAS